MEGTLALCVAYDVGYHADMPLVPSQPRLANDVTEQDHALGPATAPITLLEFGDYECPDCGNAYPVIKRLIGDLGYFSMRYAICSSAFDEANNSPSDPAAAKRLGIVLMDENHYEVGEKQIRELLTRG